MSEQIFNNYADLVASGGYTASSGELNIQGSTSGMTYPFHVGIYNAATFVVIVLLKVTGANSSTQYAVAAEGTDASAAADSLIKGSLITAAAMSQIKYDAFGRNVESLSFSGTPTFDLSEGDQKMTLTGNVTSSTVTNLLAGMRVMFCLVQDGTGSRTFTWPSNVKGGMVIGSMASKVNIQEFWSPDGTTLYATGPGLLNQ